MIKLVSVKKSDVKGKKYKATFEIKDKDGNIRKKTTNFGQKGASDYIINKNKVTRNAYLNRHKKDLETNDPTRAGFLSYFLLWGKYTSLADNIVDYIKRLKEYNKTGVFDEEI